MATYSELHNLLNDSDLLDNIEFAAIVAAHDIVGGAAANQIQLDKWAEQTFGDTRSMAKRLIPFVLAANKGLTVATIQGAGDSAFQNNVNAAVDLFADLIV